MTETFQDLSKKNEELQARLDAAEEALRAIQNGEVDALVVYQENTEQVFILEGADHTYRVMVEKIQEGVATLHPDGMLLYANQRLADMLGERLEALLGSSLFSYITPTEQAIYNGLLRKVHEGSSRGEVELRQRDGSTLPVLFSMTWVENQAGPSICLVATDLTEQKRQEEILASERLARSILDQAAEAIIVCDLDGTIIHASRATLDLAQENPLFQPFDAIFPLECNETEEPDRCFSIQAVLKGKSYHGIENSLTVQVSTRYFHVSATPLRNEDEEIVGCIVTMFDITDRKRAQTHLEELTQKLRRSNRELEQFAFVASHDLQEPLRKIQMFGNLLKEQMNGKNAEDEVDSIAHMQNAASRMEAMIDSLLELSRITTHIGNFEEVELTSLVEEVVSDLEARIQLTGGHITIGELPSAEVDQLQIRRLFQNLISNALKFHQPGVPPQVRVHATLARLGTIPCIQIIVEDNGIGFEEKYTEEIFRPFRRLHGRNEFEGTGMGLAICQKIVERHHGKIETHSQPGVGSSFVISLPVKQSS